MTAHQNKIPVILLHGFTGSGDDWLTVIKKIDGVCDPIAINLVGHGPAEPPEDISAYTIDSQVERILSIADGMSLEKFVLSGYSMGGRIALSFAAGYPDRIYGLILESSTAGIESGNERQRRIEGDEKLARFIESNGIETFIDRWMNSPMFASQRRLPGELWEEIKFKKVKNSKIALTNTLRSAGTGHMRPLWHRLHHFDFPVLLITGSIDEKFTGINRRMAQRFSNCRHEIIDDSGHNVHLEKPDEYCNVVKIFLDSLNYNQ
jgi:2-succinyl-6-hydroxy-2,4-cyclohexadiene-1-carboxylate synthase